MTAFVWTLTGCGGDTASNSDNTNYENKVIMHALSDPTELTPFNSTGDAATAIHQNIFQFLLSVDYKTYELLPVLAKARPVFTDLPGGKIRADFEIRPEATPNPI